MYALTKWPPLALSLTLLFAAAPGYSCTVTTSAIAFGSYDPLNSQAVDTVGDIEISCEQETGYNLSLSQGTSMSYDPRTLISNTDTLAYNLYTGATHQIIWGDGAEGTVTISGTADPTAVEHIYGLIPGGQNAPAGIYQDTLILTIEY
ncbi:Csu type fimbrial protein [Marinimicrobium alkaliphilum]|uniref:Csu type fimbrial protein n=1 Tax=Marinimicrobium alkaliphilum TaxID=2202654 RepID=UPI000DBA9BA9|nr:spore coat U domain-containing protein [Marinimicrobium alkaliphilum]